MYGVYIYIYLDEWLIFMVNVGKYYHTWQWNSIFFQQDIYVQIAGFKHLLCQLAVGKLKQ